MAKRERKTGTSQRKPITPLLVEGDTETLFWNRVKKEKLADCRVRIEILNGNFNVNRKVLKKLVVTDEGQLHCVYCCLDLESRNTEYPPGFDLPLIRRKVEEKGWTHICSIDLIPVNQMIESWFFYDIEGIFNFLRTQKSKRNPRKYHPPEKNRKEDLKRLFREHGKMYIEGRRSQSLIDTLDISKICQKCNDLSKGITLILKNGTR